MMSLVFGGDGGDGFTLVVTERSGRSAATVRLLLDDGVERVLHLNEDDRHRLVEILKAQPPASSIADGR